MFVLCILFCLSSCCVLCPMFTAAHSWLSRRFSMFVLCIFVCLRFVYCIQCLQLPIPGCSVGFLCWCCVFLFVFFQCIVSNVYSCPFLVVPSVFYVGVVYFCLSSFSVFCPMFPAARSWLSRRFSMFVLCILFCLSSFCLLCPMFTAAHSWLSRRFSMFVLCIFVYLRAVYCVQCLQLPIPGCPVGFLCLCYVFLFIFVLCIVFNDQEWAAVNIGYNTQHEDKQKYITQT
jgi:hypothetical protein